MSELTDLTIKEAKDKLKNKEFTTEELVKAHTENMDKYKNLNAFITETKETAITLAKKADEKLKDNSERELEGIPIGMKDLFCTKSIKTTAGSKILENFIPEYESTVSQKLSDVGTILMGKTNIDEFAMGSSNLTSAYGSVTNPYKRNSDNEELVPGGSSGGSAAAVAQGLVMAATGTDTGGSIRQPAAFTGICGIKPTYGRCSRWGCIAFASSLDHPGAMARTVYDSAVMLKNMAGFDEKDSTSAPNSVPDFTKALENIDVTGMKIGIPKEYDSEGLNDEMKSLWEKTATWFKDGGAEIIDITLPHTKYGLPAYYITAPAEASSNLARYDGVRYGYRTENAKDLEEMYKNTRAEGFGDEVKRRILIGTAVLSAGFYDAYYMKAAKIRRLISNDFDNAFKKVDVILTPTTPTAAFAKNENLSAIDMYLNDIFTVTANLAGVPAMSVPAGFSKTGLPLGMQLIGRKFDEMTVLKSAGFIENARGFENKPSSINKK